MIHVIHHFLEVAGEGGEGGGRAGRMPSYVLVYAPCVRVVVLCVRTPIISHVMLSFPTELRVRGRTREQRRIIAHCPLVRAVTEVLQK